MAMKDPFNNPEVGAGKPEGWTPFGGSRPLGERVGRWMRRWCTRCTVEQLLGIIVLIIILAGLGKLAVGYGFLPGFDFPRTAGNKWQAVFLTDNQVYFGHLKSYNRSYAVLTDAYYLQVAQNLQQQVSGAPQQMNLIKLGTELHGPEDHMFIPKNQIFFWEDLRSDSQVMQAIQSTRK